MSNALDLALKAIKADLLLESQPFETQWDLFCEQYEPLFKHVTSSKPQNAPTHHLLGILTKAHIDSQSMLQTHLNSVKKMEQVFEENLGKEKAGLFENQSLAGLVFVTHLWLYLQGYLKMDFSLANDHAQQTSVTVHSLTEHDTNALRTEFMASFYLGNQHSPIIQSANPVVKWLRSLFGG